MNGRDREPPDDPGPAPALRAALDALPVERMPRPASWEQVRSAIEATRHGTTVPLCTNRTDRSNRTLARRLITGVLTGAAAVLMLATAARLVRSAGQSAADPLRGLPSWERRDPRVLAVLEQTKNWRAALGDSLRSARWPLEARTAIEGALTSTEQALASARAALARDPADPGAREAISVLRGKQLALLQHAMTLLDEI